MNNTVEAFDYNSLRAREARLGKKLNNKVLQTVILTLILISIIVGVFLTLIHSFWCWLCFSLAIFLGMLIFWIKCELVSVPVGRTERLNDVLSNDVLANLPRNPKTKDLANLVKHTSSGKFLNVRYGISSNMLENIAASLPENPAPIFATALKIKQGTDSEEIHGAIIAVSIIANLEGSDYLLHQMKLEMVDLLDGIVWFNYLNGLVKSIGKKRHSGGIARDLSFGYIPTLQRFSINISKVREGSMKTQIHLTTHKEILIGI